MEKEFVPYEQALALKELGFNEPCLAIHSINLMTENEDWELRIGGVWKNQELVDSIKAPTFSQAFRWFREKYFKMCFVYYDVEYKFCFCIGYNDKTKGFKTYEEAELACLIKLIEIVKKK